MKHNLKLDFTLVDHWEVDSLIGESEMGYVALMQNVVVNLRQKHFLGMLMGL